MNKLTIGIISPLLDGYYYGSLNYAIYQQASLRGARLIAVRTGELPASVTDLAGGQVDGWIVLGDHWDEQELSFARNGHIPVARIGQIETPGIQLIRFDEYGGMYEATRHLIQHGHQRIAFIGPLHDRQYRARYEGYASALQRDYIPIVPELIFESASTDYETGIAAGDWIVERNFHCTAAVAATDSIALGLMVRLGEFGCRVPDRLAIVGFGDTPSASGKPGLTTVQLPYEQIGKSAVDWIIQAAVRRSGSGKPMQMPSRVVYRTSCGCRETQSEAADSHHTEARVIHYLEHMLRNNQRLGLSLLRSTAQGLQQLGRALPPGVRWGMLGLWDPEPGTMLRISHYFHRDDPAAEGPAITCPPELFPPLERLHPPFDQQEDEMTALIPIRTEHRDWGVIALVGKYDLIRTYGDSGSMTHYHNMVAFSLEREEKMKEIAFLAFHDSLTGLPNRLHFAESVRAAVKHAAEHGHQLALLLIDLDDFKQVNDRYGHPIGDKLLCLVADRMSNALRLEHLVARLGGDEFVILLPYIQNEKEAVEASRIVLDKLKEPFVIDGKPLSISGSLGISIYPRDGEDLDSLYNRSDQDMYMAKFGQAEQAVARLQPQGELRPAASSANSLESKLRASIADGTLRVFYQPQIDLETGRLHGVEALARWKTGDEIVLPSEFIPLAESSGLIVPLGQYVLEEACRQLAVWQANGLMLNQISINLSPIQMLDPEFSKNVLATLDRYGLHPKRLCLEVKESEAMHDAEAYGALFDELRKHGVRIALDDFGTGQSSLVSVQQLPVTNIKLNRLFIGKLNRSLKDAAVVRSIIAFAHSLGLEVVAEGVETGEELDSLKRMNCDLMQGYLIDRPLPADQFTEKYLRNIVAKSL